MGCTSERLGREETRCSLTKSGTRLRQYRHNPCNVALAARELARRVACVPPPNETLLNTKYTCY